MRLLAMKKINQAELLLHQIKSELAAVRRMRYLISHFLHTFAQLTLEAFASRLKIGLPNCFETFSIIGPK